MTSYLKGKVPMFLTIVSIFTCFLGCKNNNYKIVKAVFYGESNFLIGKSNVDNSMLFSSLSLKGKVLNSNIFDISKNIICRGFVYGNYIGRYNLIVVDSKSSVFDYNLINNKRTLLRLPIDSNHLEFGKIKVQKFNNQYGIYINLDNALEFINIQNFAITKLVTLKDLNSNYSNFLSFDILNDKLLFCVRKGIGDVYTVDYFILNTHNKMIRKIFSVQNKTAFDFKFQPVVTFKNIDSYYTNSYDGHDYLLENSIKNAQSLKKYDLGSMQIFNMAADSHYLYLNLFNLVQQDNSKANFDEKLITGYNIYKMQMY
ncbi:hypothetical protein HDF19_06030 [Mucilaginibacter sp. E4BP6]|uniref:hypothetical protein n=1 Tax=Mucilaginibacter sp. E4BP6 TaxID=2723089 RepID=UPI0015C8D7D3|nr:hypothetical protein [Mucilaginibacter sp. E4BP6]NYE68652.1 hypothetical protein [Mucilaginibacter sp. E4BP6]